MVEAAGRVRVQFIPLGCDMPDATLAADSGECGALLTPPIPFIAIAE